MTALEFIVSLSGLFILVITVESLGMKKSSKEGELIVGVGWEFALDNVEVLVSSLRDNIVDSSSCCPRCKDLAPTTQMFNFYDDSFYSRPSCQCFKPKTNSGPLATRQIGDESGLCGGYSGPVATLRGWTVAGGGHLGTGTLFTSNKDEWGQQHLGYEVDVEEAKQCCRSCRKLYPATQMFSFTKNFNKCYCYAAIEGITPIVITTVYESGYCAK